MRFPRAVAWVVLAVAAAVPPAGVASARGEPAQSFRWRDRFVEVRDGGALGRVYREAAWVDEMARIEPPAGARPANTWAVRYFIFRALRTRWADTGGAAHDVDVRLSDADVEDLRAAVALFERSVRAYSGGRLEVGGELTVVDEPLTRLAGDAAGGFSAWCDVVGDAMAPHVPEGAVDNVIVFWPAGGMPLPFWGGTTGGGTFRGAGYTCIAVLDERPLDVETYAEVALHEWLHQADWCRAVQGGYGGLPDLHGAEELGYVPDHIRRGWLDWYRDFMTVYFTPRMWETLSMLRPSADRPAPHTRGGLVRDWLVLGPFPNDRDAGLARPFIDDEAGAAPDAGETAAERDWRTVPPADALDFLPLMSPPNDGVAYAFSYVRGERDRPARLWIGSDDGVRVWWNGRLVHDRHEHRPLTPDQDVVDVRLGRGWNRLLVKVDQGGGGWGLAVRLTTPEGDDVPGLRATARRPAGPTVRPTDLPPVAVPRPRDWFDLRDDPFRKLPLLQDDALAALLGVPRAHLATGDQWLALTLPEAGAAEADPAPPADRPLLDPVLDFTREGLAWVRCGRRDLFLVRCDLMDLLADRGRGLDWRRSVVGWVSLSGRPAFVVSGRLATPPAREVDLVRPDPE